QVLYTRMPMLLHPMHTSLYPQNPQTTEGIKGMHVCGAQSLQLHLQDSEKRILSANLASPSHH
ncbi:LOW QUALITY PROTEIN: hypothetical protein CFOL_v3_18073, partial [Cephalotus follicularis]